MSKSDPVVRILNEFLDKIGFTDDPIMRMCLKNIVREAYWEGHSDGIAAYRDALAEERAKDEQRRARQ